MRHESKHSQLAMYCHRILNSLASTDFVVNSNFLRFAVCDESLPEPQFDGVLQKPIDSGFVVANRTTYRITKNGILLKNIMNGLVLSSGLTKDDTNISTPRRTAGDLLLDGASLLAAKPNHKPFTEVGVGMPNHSRRERQILDILFKSNQATATQIRDAMADPPSNAAVRSTLRILADKKAVSFRKEGNKFVYLARKRKAAGKSELQRVLNVFYDGSIQDAVAAHLPVKPKHFAVIPRSNHNRRESQILDIVYRFKKATLRQISEAMVDPPSDVTVRAILKVLVEKKAILSRKVDRKYYVYRPRKKVSDGRAALQHVLEIFYDGSIHAAVEAHCDETID